MSKPVLETKGLTIRFGGHVAVDSVSAVFHAGTLTAIVGPNGAGKTTYFNLISGQLPATAGSVLLDGVDVTMLGADGTTFVKVITTIATTTGVATIDLPPGQFRVEIGGFTANFVSITGVPA